MSLRRLAPFLLLAAGCEQIIGADFSKPSEIRDTSPINGEFPDPDKPNYASKEAFCDAFTDAVCSENVIGNCWSGGDCVTTTRNACLDRFAGGNKGFLHPSAALDCVNRTQKAIAEKIEFSGNDKYNRLLACRQAFGRFSQIGEECTLDEDCANFTTGFKYPCMVTAQNKATCIDLERSIVSRQLGLRCDDPAKCDGGYCDPTPDPPLCAKRPDVIEGSPCLLHEACEGRSSIDYVCIDSKCTRYLTELSNPNVCADDRVCNNSFCLDGACVETLVFSKDSAACGALRANPLIGAL